VKLAPLRLDPIFVPRIWGSRDLRPLFCTPAQEAEPIGEVWLTGESCQVASGPLAGRSVGEIWPGLPAEVTGSRAFGAPRIPLLVKFIFPEDKLSVQVHPDDDYAREHEAAAGGTGKTEMWYAVSARAGSEVRLGLEQGVTRESFRQAMANGTVEKCLRRHEVKAGEAFFIPAGTAHMIGPGMVLCELQEHSDLTYRVFDYNRLQADGKPRQLHTRQALDVMNFGAQRGGVAEIVHIQRGPLTVTYLAACRYFVVERWEFSERAVAATSPESFELLVALAGNGRIECGSENFLYGAAQVWLLPAGLGAYQISPETPTILLRSYVPDVDKFAQTLAGEGIAKAEVSRLVHR
jgi:mannose-6-phosphate isomerase